MSNYPVWWDSTVTIYNKYEDPVTRVVKWYKHTVDGCFWKYVGNKVTVADVTINSEQVTCRIPKDILYVDSYVWKELTDTEKQEHFTLSTGDIIVNGDVEDTIDEYTQGYRSTDFISKYKALQGCMQISRVAIDTGTGRCCEHYYVIGE